MQYRHELLTGFDINKSSGGRRRAYGGRSEWGALLRVRDFELSESSGWTFLSNAQAEDGHLVNGSVEVVGVTR